MYILNYNCFKANDVFRQSAMSFSMQFSDFKYHFQLRKYVVSLCCNWRGTPCKPSSTSDGPKVDDVVLIKEPIVSREKWKTARIVEIVGDEVHARRFKLRDAAGNELDRHITGIVKLELN